MHGHYVNDILESFAFNKLSIVDFLVTVILKDKGGEIQDNYRMLVADLLIGADQILDAFATHPATTESTKKWAHNQSKGCYGSEIRKMAGKSAGFHFNAINAKAHQILGFDVGSLIPLVANEVPFLWDLNRSMLGSDTNIFESNIDDTIHVHDVQALMRIGNILYGANRRCNMFASIMGIFLHTCNAPTHVIDALWRLGVSISASSIDKAITSLSSEAENNLKALGPSFMHAIVLDNIDLQKKRHTPVVEEPDSTMFNLTSGTLIRLVNCSVTNLKFSSFLWDRSPENDMRTIQLPNLTMLDLFALHPDAPHTSGLTRKERFMAYLFAIALCTHGPDYFQQFQSLIPEPDGIDKVSVDKTVQIPLKTMDFRNSSIDGNINTLNNVLRQLGIEDFSILNIPGVGKAEEMVLIIHGDLGTAERIQSARIRRSLERTPQLRLQFVVFVPGLFHVKMACMDALIRLFIEPPECRKDETSFFKVVDRLYPSSSSRIANNNASFQHQYQPII